MNDYEKKATRNWAIESAIRMNKKGAPIKKILRDAELIDQFQECRTDAKIITLANVNKDKK